MLVRCVGNKNPDDISLIECAMVRYLWALEDEEILQHISATTEHNAKSWILVMLESMRHDEFVKVLVAIHEGDF
jgi:hypothetical protein